MLNIILVVIKSLFYDLDFFNTILGVSKIAEGN